ncbi:MAG: hypothetical protein FD135_4959, partial [Comamonadaceae bacterium]
NQASNTATNSSKVLSESANSTEDDATAKALSVTSKSMKPAMTPLWADWLFEPDVEWPCMIAQSMFD